MSKIQETAPEEIFLIVGPTNDTDFKELSDVTWADKPVYEETAIKYVKHPKLSIPKKIAEELDMILKEYPGWIYEGFHRLASRSLMMWCENNNGFNNCVAYLAGKALGVVLVEVTDE